ncbi:MAG: 4,5-DOPA dioxygenase extradiol [Actinomycetota bacterium]|jgi:4,5-DOPA dioxygenase extradiol|nr:4,5-DOPA dioxygenase extradiol [Actinomycetota bacterium]
MPAAFVGHGSPMNAVEHNRFTGAWSELAASCPRPRAILAVSAHWYVNASAVTAMERPRTIHDFFGFPEELFSYQYPCAGDPMLARSVVDLAQPAWVGLDEDSWGIDHGTWLVLAHMFPAADVPVVQLSVHAGEPIAYHLELGKRLAPLREDGVLVLASGNVVHNLRRVDFSRPDAGAGWARQFDSAVQEVMTSDPKEIVSMTSHPAFGLCAPTPDHFLPLAYLAGMAEVAGEPARVLVEGCAYSSLSMTSYVIGTA